MPDVSDYFPHLEQLDIAQLHMRRVELLGTAPDGDVTRLADEPLAELLAINRMVRRKQSGPPKARTSKATQLEDLA